MNDIIAHIEKEEGLRLKVYFDTVRDAGMQCPRCHQYIGYPTIGYGRNLMTRGILPDEARNMLEHDLNEVIDALQKIFGHAFWLKLSRNRQIALISLVYNIGETSFLRFKRFITAVKNENWEHAAKELIYINGDDPQGGFTKL